jgi:uncharacterized membrane protein
VKREAGVEPVIRLLCLVMIFFTGVLIYCAHMFPNDGVVFTVFSGLLNNCGGALFMRIKQGKDASGDDNSTTIISKVTEQPQT